MRQTSGYISFGSEKLHYLQWGTGSQLLLAFHGYGNTAAKFDVFRPYLAAKYTVLSFDLPYHGGSQWQNGQTLQTRELIASVRTVMKQFGAEKITLMGYSMGGRVCMSIVEHLPDSVHSVLLMAADGLATNKLYYFFTRTITGKRLFNSALNNPEKYFKLVSWLKKKNFIDESRHKFAMQYLQSEETRTLLLQRWPALSDVMPNIGKAKRAIKKYRIPVTIIMGKYDRLMPPRLAEKFKQGLDTVHVSVIEKGHRVFDETNAREIAAHLLLP